MYVTLTGSARSAAIARGALMASALLLAGCVGGGDEGDEGAESSTGAEVEAGICGRFLACAEALQDEDLAAHRATYAGAGSCWGATIDEQRGCVDACKEGLAGGEAAAPGEAACAPPKRVDDAVLEIGHAVFDPFDPFAWPTWERLEDGDPLPMVRGGQGLLMFAVGLRGANFVIGDDPFDFSDPMMPQIDLWMDIEGHNVGFAGHFARVYNYPIPFQPMADDPGVLEFMYVSIIVPDALSDPYVVDGKPGKIWLEMQPFGEAPIVRELDVVAVVEGV
ncbi:MAG: hypothetical protein IPK80_12590 [Nannocystis sp.]|nr:hypothetical protein [Nannocystis sp.]